MGRCFRHRLLITALLVGLWTAGCKRTSSPDQFRPLNELTKPAQIKPAKLSLIELPHEPRFLVEPELPSSDQVTVSAYLHALRVLACEDQEDLSSQIKDLSLPILRQTKALPVFDKPIFTRTRDGIRVVVDRRSAVAESHRDQCLCTFAELGMPLSTIVIADGATHCIRDLLADSIARFDLSQRELAWTAIVYGLYLSPTKSWKNRFGDSYTFDDLAGRLLEKDVGEGSCAGTHTLFALAILRRLDDEYQLLPQSRDAVTSHLSICVAEAVRMQEPDGSWNPNWAPTLRRPAASGTWSDRDTTLNRLLVTSHLAEWLLYLPAELRPSSHVIRKAGSWLLSQLRTASADERIHNFCAFSHAKIVIRLIHYTATTRVAFEAPVTTFLSSERR